MAGSNPLTFTCCSLVPSPKDEIADMGSTLRTRMRYLERAKQVAAPCTVHCPPTLPPPTLCACLPACLRGYMPGRMPGPS